MKTETSLDRDEIAAALGFLPEGFSDGASTYAMYSRRASVLLRHASARRGEGRKEARHDRQD